MKIYWWKVRKLRIFSVLVLLCFWNNVGAVDSSATPEPPDAGERCILSQDEELGLDAMDMILKHLPEEMTNPAAICRNEVGQGSYLCRDMYNGNYSSICSGVWCSVPGSSQCTRVSATDGVPCGDQKWCRGAVCRFSAVASRRLETCPFGDINSGEVGGVSCQEMISSDRKLCYDTSIQQMCCQSCDDVVVYRSSEMCRYGDRVDGCQLNDCLFASIGQFCCQTCSIVIEPLPTQMPPDTSTRPAPGTQTTSPTSRIQTSHTGQTQQTAITGQTTRTAGQTTGEVRQTTRTTRNLGTGTTRIGQTGTISSTTTRSFPPNSSTRPTVSSSGQSESTRNTQPSTTPSANPLSTRNVQQSVTPNVESSSLASSTRQGQSSTVSQGVTSDPNSSGESDAQQDSGNVVAMGTGIAVAAVLVVIIVITVYVVRRRVTSQSWDSGSDGGDSNEPVAPTTPSDLRGTHTTWFPNYGSVNRPTFYYAENAGFD